MFTMYPLRAPPQELQRLWKIVYPQTDFGRVGPTDAAAIWSAERRALSPPSIDPMPSAGTPPPGFDAMSWGVLPPPARAGILAALGLPLMLGVAPTIRAEVSGRVARVVQGGFAPPGAISPEIFCDVFVTPVTDASQTAPDWAARAARRASPG